MKMLSKSVLASILSTLVAASAIAQCPSGGCPWGSYNRNYGGGSGGYNSYSYPQQGYYYAPSRAAYGHEGDHFGHPANHAYPYPYGGQTYYNDFEDHKGFEYPAGGYDQGYNRSGFQHDDYDQGGQMYGHPSDQNYGFGEHPVGNQDFNYSNQGYDSGRSYNTASQGQNSGTYTNTPSPAPQPNTSNTNAR